MVKVALVEDEMVTLKGMANFLRKMPNVELVGYADNGIDGLQLIIKEQPEIVFTDIRMPGMTGLEMIERVQLHNPDIVFVIFSGFDEFKYVQQAMHYGVLEYLDKPVTVGKLKEALSRAEAAVEYKRNYRTLRSRNDQVEKVIVEKILGNLFNQPSGMEKQNIEQLLKTAEDLSLSTEIAVLCIDQITVCAEAATQETYQRVINTYSSDLLRDHQVEVFTLSLNEKIYFIYFNQECELFPFHEQFEAGKKQLADEDEIEFYAGMSSVGQNIYLLRQLMVEATSAYQYARYLEIEETVSINSVEYCTNIQGALDSEQSPFLMNLRLRDFELCRKQLKEFVEKLRLEGTMPFIMKHECIKVVNSIARTAQEMSRSSISVSDDIAARYEEAATAREITEYTMAVADTILRQLEEHTEEEQRPTQIVRKYMEEHYAEQITLDLLAEIVDMNPTYLSMVFKKDEGVSYSSLLMNIRMKKAEQMLRAGEKAKDVCEKVGYYDYRYFSRQFRKVTGFSPDTYKQMHMN